MDGGIPLSISVPFGRPLAQLYWTTQPMHMAHVSHTLEPFCHGDIYAYIYHGMDLDAEALRGFPKRTSPPPPGPSKAPQGIPDHLQGRLRKQRVPAGARGRPKELSERSVHSAVPSGGSAWVQTVALCDWSGKHACDMHS